MTREFPIRLIREGMVAGEEMPVSIALVDIKDIQAAGISQDSAIRRIAAQVGGAVGINLFDMLAVTTTSDGIVVEGAIVKIAAGDMGKVHNEFGILPMTEMAVTDSLIAEEPHLQQISANYRGRKLFRGPDPKEKLIPVHNVAITGRAANNNSGSEMMNLVSMSEILLPILGQLQIMRDFPVLVGKTGECISVGIGLTVAEKYGRVFPTRQFQPGDTAHGSGIYAKNLKSHIPCIVAPKRVLAAHIIRALNMGMIPGLHLGASPAVLAVARALGSPIASERITQRAKEELASIGIKDELLVPDTNPIAEAELLARADEIIPGAEGMVCCEACELATSFIVTDEESTPK